MRPRGFADLDLGREYTGLRERKPVLESILLPHSRMKVAISSPNASTYSETFIRLQADRLPCAVRIHGLPVATETVPGGPFTFRSARGLWDVVVGRGLRHLGNAGPQTAELCRRLKRFGVDAVLANFGPCGVALLRVCDRLGLPLVVHFHGVDAHSDAMVNANRRGYRELGKRAAAVVAVSHRMADALEELEIPREKIHVTRCGVSPEKFRAKSFWPERPVFFGAGRFVDKKAPYLTVLAFARALVRIPDAKLVLAGDGALLEVCSNLANVLGIERSVEFRGVLKPDEVADELQGATAYVQHSIVPKHGPSSGDCEGTPVSVMEAMVSGVPVISTRHAGIAEIIEHGRTGWLVEERDIDGMADAMVQIAQSQELAREMGQRARVAALGSFTADRYISDLSRILVEASR
jgi:glycosyltransferase involved in cell wall biosynthesis